MASATATRAAPKAHVAPDKNASRPAEIENERSGMKSKQILPVMVTATQSGTNEYLYAKPVTSTIAVSLPVIPLHAEIADLAIKIYPNPTSDILNLEADIPIQKVRIYSNEGRLIRTGESQINGAGIETGTYMLRILLNDGSQVSKRVIIRN